MQRESRLQLGGASGPLYGTITGHITHCTSIFIIDLRLNQRPCQQLHNVSTHCSRSVVNLIGLQSLIWLESGGSHRQCHRAVKSPFPIVFWSDSKLPACVHLPPVAVSVLEQLPQGRSTSGRLTTFCSKTRLCRCILIGLNESTHTLKKREVYSLAQCAILSPD